MTIQRVELGCAGHLIVSNSCRWRRHTQVGLFRISTVGDYRPAGGKRDTVGSGEFDFFETIVFRTTGRPEPNNQGCGCFEVTSWEGLDQERYATEGDAQAGHEKYVQKYLKIAELEAINL